MYIRKIVLLLCPFGARAAAGGRPPPLPSRRREYYRRRKLFCIESALHTPWIPVSMLALDFAAGGVMNIQIGNNNDNNNPDSA